MVRALPIPISPNPRRTNPSLIFIIDLPPLTPHIRPVSQRHIAGHDYFYALSELLDSATECIFILDWWLSPEIYLRRPPALHEEWRLDRLLQKKAQQGVKIFVVVYSEVPGVATLNSEHTQVSNVLRRLGMMMELNNVYRRPHWKPYTPTSSAWYVIWMFLSINAIRLR